MLNTIISLLRSSGVHAWEVADTKTRGWEFYFIRHELDQNRAKEVEHINVRVAPRLRSPLRRQRRRPRLLSRALPTGRRW